jgi:hypothetical protein
MNERRRNALSERQREAAWRDLQVMLKDAHVADEIQALGALVDESPEMVIGERWWRAPGLFGERLRALAGYCNEYEFAFARLQGPYLEQWLAMMAADESMRHAGFDDEDSQHRLVDHLAPEHTDRLFSEHPTRILPGGKHLDDRTPTMQENADMRAYDKSLQPLEKRGPKTGSHQANKREPGPPEKQCLKVYDLRVAGGLDWPEIYRQMHPGSSVSPADAFKWGKPRYDKELRLLGLPPEEDVENTPNRN